MSTSPDALLRELLICDALAQAWLQSNPGIDGGHEEGGFIVLDANGSFRVVRWPNSAQRAIVVPAHPECRINGMEIVPSFHTHPNTGSDAIQEPDATDRRAVRDDRDLKHPGYIGEFVLSEQSVYLVAGRPSA